MEKIKSKLIDIINFPLFGKILIESSAGTGKTFSLAIIYLRLLLGITNNAKNSKKLLVKEILVVTFTEHAIQELKSRINKNIKTLKKACINKYSNDKTFTKLLSKITNFSQAINILTQAEYSMHEQSIYTIHSFCYKIIKFNQFSSEKILNGKLLENTYSLYLKSSIKFWKYYFIFLPKEITTILLTYFNNAISLLQKIFSTLQNISSTKELLKKRKKNIIQHYREIIDKIIIFKKEWLYYKNIIYTSIIKTNINKHIYTKKNLKKWIKNINIWANAQKTENFFVPKELNYFKKSTLIQNSISNQSSNELIFEIIENFLNTNFSLKKFFLLDACLEIKNIFLKEKKKNKYFEYNDLIELSNNILKKNYLNISKKLLLKYPAVLIDEFQDTNNQQYNIFKKIYTNKKNLLILIGDPKQSIYSFRDTDICFYLKIKSKIKQQYYLNINWRSSPEMIDSINTLFLQSNNPFLIKEIPFYPVIHSSTQNSIKFQINEKIYPALQFILNKKNMTNQEYQKWISKTVSKYIFFWLSNGKKGNATLTTHNDTHNVTEQDITIIVRNKLEASIITNELKKLDIKSEYLSSKKNIFNSHEATEISWILQAILNPKDEYYLKRAMSTDIIFKNTKQILSIDNNPKYWLKLLQEFNRYLNIWNTQGILNVLKTLINNNTNSSILNKSEYTIQCNYANIINIGHILEKKYLVLKNKYLLIRWLENKIAQNENETKNKYIKKNNNLKHNIKITTIHKSKGLEYPITVIPFLSTLFKNTTILSEKININSQYPKKIINTSQNKFLKIEKHKFSEEIRLLYVALTRSSVHCSIGISPIKKKIQKKQQESIYQSTSALRYIIQSGKINNSENYLYKKLSFLSKNKNIKISSKIFNVDIKPKNTITQPIIKKNLLHEKITKKLNYNYRFTSYSEIIKNKHLLINEISSETYKQTLTKINDDNLNKDTIFSSHTFPKGKKYGILIHRILKNTPFNKNIESKWLFNELIKYNLDTKWIKKLQVWINTIFCTTLNESSNLKLCELNSKKYIKELKFSLPIKKITKTQLIQILNIKKNNIHILDNTKFYPIQGILTGIIDLIFFWKGKYFLLDYKTNWLGSSNQDYSKNTIHQIIKQYHYDFQYQLYSLALNRYLTQKVKNYNFSKHFGGIYILFLRAINENKSKNGIFYTLPNINIIKQLENIF
ncbi:MAG: exodeoxyribonuclease V subunit beta [Buchnera aphidicola (Chaetogeoica yunlongensis)]